MTSSARVAVAIAAGVVAVNAIVVGIDRTTRSPGGPGGSSYATAPDGVAAYADLLRRVGHPVERVRVDLRDATFPSNATIFLLDPGFVLREDRDALRRFVAAGARLVAGGAAGDVWLKRIVDDPPAQADEGPETARPLAPVPEVAGVTTVRVAGDASWSDVGAALPVLGSGARVTLAVARVGRGRAALLADTSPLQNRLLGAADNAALGLALAAPPPRPVYFVESVHGYGTASGLAAIPARWWFALVGLGVAALAWLLAHGRRLGPPEREARELPPPRRAYVESLAAVLARTKRPAEAVEPVQAAVRERLTRYGRTRRDPGLAAAGARVGLTPEELEAVGRPPARVDDVLALGRVLARLEQRGPHAPAKGGRR